MSLRPRPGRWWTGPLTLTVVLSAVLGGLSPASASAFPALPEPEYTHIVSQLAVPVASPGSTVVLTGELSNTLPGPINLVNLTFQFYAFNGYPGNDTGPLPSSGAPSFDTPRGSGEVDWFDVATLAPGATFPLSATVVVPSEAGAGDYAIRTGLEFAENGTTYLLESRGYFSYETWTNATSLPGGGSTLNLSRLGVSGVLPETAVLVQSNPTPYVLYALLAGAVVLAAAGGFYAVRRGPGSRSGAR